MREERRHYIRLDVRLLTFFKVITSGKTSRSLTKDISGGGIRFVIEEPIEPGTQLQVELKLPDREKALNFRAQVIWSKPVESGGAFGSRSSVEIGVRFVDIAPEDRKAILHYATLNAPPPP